MSKITCGSKYEDKKTKKENAGLMESLDLRTVRRRDTEREREHKNYISKRYSISMQHSIHVCVQ